MALLVKKVGAKVSFTPNFSMEHVTILAAPAPRTWPLGRPPAYFGARTVQPEPAPTCLGGERLCPGEELW